MEKVFTYYRDQADKVLRASAKLKDLDLETEEDAAEAIKRLQKGEPTQELFALMMWGNAWGALEELKANKEVRDAIWHTFQATVGLSLFNLREQHFEETLWQGHRAYCFLHAARSAADQSPAEAQALEALAPLLATMSETVLNAWVDDGRPLGSRLDIEGIPDETLRARLKAELIERERIRKAAVADQEFAHKLNQDRLKWLALSVALVAGILTILKGLGAG